MRMMLVLLLFTGCASKFAEAYEFAEACERKHPGQCEDYWANVEEMRQREAYERDRRDRMREIKAANPNRRSLGQSFRDAQTPTAPTYHCSTDYNGGQVCRAY